ncbi:hypothetical protein [Panacagrimonas sp.]|uniref:hypothetical protein n=1 Tax=Panacagrimonas sp. TaxID=2480088 RepID=UPI003B519238
MYCHLRRIATAAALFTCLPAHALDFDFDIVDAPNQNDFREVSKDVGALLNGKALTPAEPGGITGFGIGAFAIYVPTDDSGAWQRLTGEDIDEIGLVGLIAQKGLPFGVDVGASYATVPGSDGRLLGAELRYALIDGGIATPAVGLRGSFTSLSGLDDVDYDSYGLDISVSKGFGPLTPYAGVGYVWGQLEADPQFGLEDEDVEESRVFVGLRVSAPIGITPEYERVGDRDSFNLRFGLAF